MNYLKASPMPPAPLLWPVVILMFFSSNFSAGFCAGSLVSGCSFDEWTMTAQSTRSCQQNKHAPVHSDSLAITVFVGVWFVGVWFLFFLSSSSEMCAGSLVSGCWFPVHICFK